MDKREFLKLGILGAVGLSATTVKAGNTFSSRNEDLFLLPHIAFDNNIAQIFSKNTYNKLYKEHYSNSNRNLNFNLSKQSQRPKTVRKILNNKKYKNTAIEANASEFYNHKVFYLLISASSSINSKNTALHSAINKTYGSLENFKKTFVNESEKTSNDWLWLVHNGTDFNFVSSSVIENPLQQNQFPLIGIDLRESSYSADYGTNKTQYVSNVLNNLNWNYANKRFNRSANYYKA